MRRYLFSLLLTLASLQPVAGQAADIVLTPAQMTVAAGRALSLHRPEAALALAEALLARDPKDIRALLIKARALRDLVRNDAARDAANLAWRAANTDTERFGAALILAQALASSGRDTAAQLWLRRATQHATNDRQRALVRRDFAFLRQRNPLTLKFSFGATPSTNVNGGANTDTITLFGLPFELSADAQALSGYQAYASVDLSYRVFENTPGETRIGFSAYHRQTWLSEQAQIDAPGALGSDYNYASLSLNLSHTFQPTQEGRKYALSLALGRNWYGGQALANFANLNATLSQDFANGRQLGVSLRADVKQNADGTGAPVFLANAGVTYQWPQANGNAFRFSASLQRTVSSNAYDAYFETRAGVDYFLTKPVFGGKLSFGLGAARRDYAVSRYTANGRHDQSLNAHVDLTLNGLSVYGFSPKISVSHSRTTSNVALFSSQVTSLGLGFQSDF